MIAIIPARGGSKGLPGKNIKPLLGKPLIAYTIEAALKSKHISRVIVSTEDEEIAKVAEFYGAEIPFMRPHELATDESSSIDVLLYTINRLNENSQVKHTEIIVLQPTSPLRTHTHIDEAIQLFFDRNAEAVLSFCKERHPIFWNKFITDDGKFESIFSEDFLMNRQMIKPTYYPNGAIYVLNEKLLKQRTYYTDKSYVYLMDSENSIDIDTQEDFNLASYFMKKKIKSL